ncbi:putative transcriptional regulator [Chlorobaculum parvum NCIB 8327]|uniref:Transcriptional regulator n=1 Tax=Chlorobaculum parvum (strain DSM 263 / NCIMB 8327) TaxID=517417 RepID=B3QMN6_CHLP8|nr:RNA-binding domain-containing protein [Chlorobaculum parvum]ACF11189.1 putative transcriptional regulator [Chlorobaculum parvum NCIB 8327]
MTFFRKNASGRSLLDLVEKGEGPTIEFKRLIHSAPKIARSIVSFANTSGGTILIGVDDDRRIVGIQSEKEMLAVIDEALRYHVEPKPRLNVRIEEFKRRMVLLIDIPESPERPHFHIERLIRRDTGKRTVERRVFMRDGSHNKAVNEDQIALMLSSKEPVRLSFTDREKRLLDYLSDHERITADEFAENACIPMREARRILVSLVRSGMLRLVTEGRSSSYTLTAH